MRTTYNLPDVIALPSGEILKAVIGGTLDNKPFIGPCDFMFEHEEIKREARRLKLKYRRIGVLSRTLRGKYDLHGRLYRPNVWSYVQTGRWDG